MAVGTSLEQAYTTYTYTSSGQQENVIDANGNRAQMVYDGFDRLSQWVFPSKTAPGTYAPGNQAGAMAQAGGLNTADYEEYTYDANGNRKSLRKRDGSMLSYDYDALNRMTRKVVPDGAGLSSSATRDVYYTYDLQGHQTDARFDTATGEGVHSTFDGFGREKSHKLTMDGIARENLYEYDANNNRTRVTQPDGAYTRYEYDGLDRLKQAWWGWTNVSGEQSFSVIAYNANGLRETITRGSSTTTYSYDNALRLSNLALNLTGSAGDLTEAFVYNQANQITQMTTSNNAYVYKARFNVNRPYSVNGLNQYTSINDRSFCYDANGNLTADGDFVYLYDVENRLVEKRAQTNANCSALSYTGPIRATLRYDPMGRLYETAGNVTGITRMAYDGDSLIAEYNSAGNLQRRYLWGARTDEPLAWDEGGLLDCSGTHFLAGNHQGSIVATADCNGNLTRSFAYDEYGMPQAGDGAPLTPMAGARFLYTGQAYQPDLGMYYYKARMYSPTLGRFMQTDPIGYDDQTNLYSYVANDPVNKTDPMGESAEDIVVRAARIAFPTIDLGGLNGILTASRAGPWGIAAFVALYPSKLGDGTCSGHPGGCVLANDSDAAWDEVVGDAETDDDGQLVKPGGEEGRDKDFDKARGNAPVKTSKDGKVKYSVLPDGRRLVARPSTVDGRPTLQRQSPKGNTGTKIRYD